MQGATAICGGENLSYEDQDAIDALFSETASFWEDVYADTSLATLIYRHRQDLALDWIDNLALPPRAAVLEVGCGASGAAVALARRGFTVTAVDHLPQMVEIARSHADRMGASDRVRTAVGDVHALDLESNSFSLALALGVLPWLHAPSRAVREISRVLRPGGYVVASADNRAAFTNLVEPLENPLLRPAKELVKRVAERRGWRAEKARRNPPLSRRALRGMLGAAGLEAVATKTFGFGPFEVLHRPLLPETMGVVLYHWLQNLADHQVSVVRAAGAQHLFLALKRSTDVGSSG